ncbi:MAG TPA: TonB-dependent receptor plug domain-containing protein, partial [Chitinophagaceae bacterium]|nr:TonB-dependent receptor plug domain-containing protein [Chitinophagaceae bacterium]
MKQTVYILLFSFFIIPCFSQKNQGDTLKTLDSVIVKSYELYKKASYTPIPICSIPVSIADFSGKTSLVNGLNAVAGVRMEERSPGSYRINIRGSSLRSPFGVRNIKVYWNGIPVTDPGGNTYFNQFTWNNFSSIEITKGPAGSMYGAGTGGLILLNNFEGAWQPGASLEYISGSYNLHNIFASAKFGTQQSKNYLGYAHNQTDGYRVQTNMRRNNFSWQSQLKRGNYEMTASVLFTDLFYQTPGALTLAEFNTDPKAARPAGGGFPGAVNAKAAIFQKNFLAGVNNSFNISSSIKNNTTIYGSYTQVKNSAIRNYERRNEPSFGGRTFFSWEKKNSAINITTIAGAEFQQGYFNTQVSKNKNGNPDTLQTNDDITTSNLSLFIQSNAEFGKNWSMIGGFSVTKSKLAITRLNRYPVTAQSRTYRNELAPKLAVMKKINNNMHWLASVSKGFSPPTVGEVLPSTGVISTYLEAEKGWNYETNFRFFLLKNRLKLELTGFYFNLDDALVQRRDAGGADFFINAGDIKQKGIEFHADYTKTVFISIIRKFSIRTDFT